MGVSCLTTVDSPPDELFEEIDSILYRVFLFFNAKDELRFDEIFLTSE
jgi:hypothetical protein